MTPLLISSSSHFVKLTCFRRSTAHNWSVSDYINNKNEWNHSKLNLGNALLRLYNMSNKSNRFNWEDNKAENAKNVQSFCHIIFWCYSGRVAISVSITMSNSALISTTEVVVYVSYFCCENWDPNSWPYEANEPNSAMLFFVCLVCLVVRCYHHFRYFKL